MDTAPYYKHSYFPQGNHDDDDDDFIIVCVNVDQVK